MIFGRDLIKSKLENIPELPGVYMMYDIHNGLIYVGKAKNLKKRVANYLANDLITRTIKLISLVCHLECTVTNSEADALLLEAQLIKKYQPKFNILLKDDKSFPYIKLQMNHDFPILLKYRGRNLSDGKLFGPFSSVGQVNTTIAELQKIFKLRSCSDSYFSGRQRACLQYQIGRCSAPCVGKISKADYQELVDQLVAFLSGKTVELQSILAKTMDCLSAELKFEEAAKIRDRIRALSYTQLKSSPLPQINMDVIAIATDAGYCCIQVFTYRGGQFYGNKSVVINSVDGVDISEVFSSFVMQYYQTRAYPSEIVINIKLYDLDITEDALSKLHGSSVKIRAPKTSSEKLLIDNAYSNAQLVLTEFIKNSAKNVSMLQEIQQLFGLDPSKSISRIEVFDNSHIMGAFAVSGMVVATPSGFDKKEYRIFSITNSIGDDYDILRQVLKRRFLRIQKESSDKTPDLIIIDGGKGHLSVASEIMNQFKLSIPFVCMSKGPERNAGLEYFHMISQQSFTIDKHKPVMKYLQILRDEAHNFAIKHHRLKRSKNIKVSSLDSIQGIGAKRKKALLSYFGSFDDILNASVEELLKAKGISRVVAEKIIESKKH